MVVIAGGIGMSGRLGPGIVTVMAGELLRVVEDDARRNMCTSGSVKALANCSHISGGLRLHI